MIDKGGPQHRAAFNRCGREHRLPRQLQSGGQINMPRIVQPRHSEADDVQRHRGCAFDIARGVDQGGEAFSQSHAMRRHRAQPISAIG